MQARRISGRRSRSVTYVEWGVEDPNVLFLTVAKKVDIDIATSGNVAWKSDPAKSPYK